MTSFVTHFTGMKSDLVASRYTCRGKRLRDEKNVTKKQNYLNCLLVWIIFKTDISPAIKRINEAHENALKFEMLSLRLVQDLDLDLGTCSPPENNVIFHADSITCRSS